MPILSNPKHELFAQGLAKGLSQDDAYAEAGFAKHRSSASRLLTDANIRARVAELQERAAVSVNITREWVLEQLIDNLRRAKSGDKMDGATANRAAELLGKELGMFVDRVESHNVNLDISAEPVTEAEWAEQVGASH